MALTLVIGASQKVNAVIVQMLMLITASLLLLPGAAE